MFVSGTFSLVKYCNLTRLSDMARMGCRAKCSKKKCPGSPRPNKVADLHNDPSGQISSRPHTTENPPKWWFSKGNGTPAISGKSRLVKYYSIWPDPCKGFPRGKVWSTWDFLGLNNVRPL